MIKSIMTQRPVKLIIEKDGKRIVDIRMPMVDGCLDIDGFKHVETITEPIDMCVTIKAEV